MEFVQRSTTNLLSSDEMEHSSGSMNEGRWYVTEPLNGDVIAVDEIGISEENADVNSQSINQFTESDDFNINDSDDFSCLDRATLSSYLPICSLHGAIAPDIFSLSQGDKLHNETANLANSNSDLLLASAGITEGYAYTALDQTAGSEASTNAGNGKAGTLTLTELTEAGISIIAESTAGTVSTTSESTERARSTEAVKISSTEDVEMEDSVFAVESQVELSSLDGELSNVLFQVSLHSVTCSPLSTAVDEPISTSSSPEELVNANSELQSNHDHIKVLEADFNSSTTLIATDAPDEMSMWWSAGLFGGFLFLLFLLRRKSLRQSQNCCCTDFIKSSNLTKHFPDKLNNSSASSVSNLERLMGELRQELRNVNEDLVNMRRERDLVDDDLIEASTQILQSLNDHIVGELSCEKF